MIFRFPSGTVGMAGLLLVVTLLRSGPAPSSHSPADENTRPEAVSSASPELPGPPIVPFVAILADPMRYHAKEVVVAGFLDGGYGTLWMSRESLEYCVVANHIVLDISKW